MSGERPGSVVLRLTAAFAGSLLLVLVLGSWWIHEQQEQVLQRFDDLDTRTVEQIADSLYDHLLLSSIVTFAVGVALAYVLTRIAIAPVQRLRRRERRLLAEAGHELRTPLATIALEAELALETDPEPQVAEALRSIMSEAHALARVADEVLEVARGDLAELAIEPFDLTPLLHERAEHARTRHSLGDDQLVVAAPPELLVTADRHATARMVDNLLDNAALHGAPPIHVDARPDGPRAVVDVVDAGGALDASRIEQLYAPFARGDDARSRPGSGLGLGIVRQLASSQGGSATLAVLDDGRTRARLELPR